jgi:hypothetical protein
MHPHRLIRSKPWQVALGILVWLPLSSMAMAQAPVPNEPRLALVIGNAARIAAHPWPILSMTRV